MKYNLMMYDLFIVNVLGCSSDVSSSVVVLDCVPRSYTPCPVRLSDRVPGAFEGGRLLGDGDGADVALPAADAADRPG